MKTEQIDISANKAYHELAFSERDNYLKFVHNLGKARVWNDFIFPGEDFSLWKFSLIAEKAPLKSNSYKDLISFLLNPGTFSYGKMRCFKDSPLYIFLNGALFILMRITRIIYTKLFLIKSASTRKRLNSYKYLIFSYFPFFDKKKAKESIFEDKYIASFHRALKEKYEGQFAHMSMYINMENATFADSLKIMKNFKKVNAIFFTEEFFGITDLFKLVWLYLYFSFLYLLKIRRIKKCSFYEFYGRKHDIWPIIKKDFFESFAGKHLATGIYYILLFKRIISRIDSQSKVITICEMQLWEKAIYAFAKKRGITTIGAQHTIVPVLLLNYFNSIPDEPAEDMLTLPDYLATVGETTRKIFIQNGWPKERVFVWGAQRFDLLRGANKKVNNPKENQVYFVCAFSINVSESKKIIYLLKDAFEGRQLNYKFILKGHPLFDIKNFIKNNGIALDRNLFEYSDEPIDEIIKSAKGLITGSSSVSLYALYCGVPVIIPRLVGSLDLNPLSYISGIPKYVYSKEELLDVCNKFSSDGESSNLLDQNRNFLNDYFYFPYSDQEYLEKIENIGSFKVNAH